MQGSLFAGNIAGLLYPKRTVSEFNFLFENEPWLSARKHLCAFINSHQKKKKKSEIIKFRLQENPKLPNHSDYHCWLIYIVIHFAYKKKLSLTLLQLE